MKALATILFFLTCNAASALIVDAPHRSHPPLAKASENIWFVKLDGRWYDLFAPAPGEPFITIPGYWIGVQLHTAQMSNCRRSDGQPMDWTPVALWYGPYMFPIWSLDFPITYRWTTDGSDIFFLEFNTIPGNVICDGEVPDPLADLDDPFPTPTPPNPNPGPGPGPGIDPRDMIFGNGFEWSFSDGFEEK